MTVIVQQPTDSNGNPQPMVYDSDTGRIIVDHDGYVLMGMDKPLIDVPSKANFINTPKTQTSGILEGLTSVKNAGGGKLVLVSPSSEDGSQYPYYITEPISVDISNLTVTIEGNGATIVAQSNFSSPDYILTLTGDTAQFVYSISGIQFWGTGTGSNSNVSGFKVVNAGAGYEYGILYTNLITGKHYAYGTNSSVQAGQISGFESVNSFYISCQTGIINEYGAVTELNPGFYNVSGTCIINQIPSDSIGVGLGNVSIVNPFIYSSNGTTPPPLLLKNYYNANFNTYISNITYWMNAGVSGTTYTLIEANNPSSPSPPNPMVFIDGLFTWASGNITILNQNNISGNPLPVVYIAKAVFAHSGTLQLKSGSGTARLTMRDSYIDTSLVTGIVASDATLIANLFNVAGYTTLSPTTISANPPVSATVYQNTNPYDIRIYLPVYATTSGTAGTVAYGENTSSTVTEMTAKYVSGSTSSTAVDIVELVVPAGHYFEFTGSGVTFGTAVVKAA